MRGTALVLAAGEGERLEKSEPKAFVPLAGIPLLRRAVDAACAAELVDRYVLAVPKGFVRRANSLIVGASKPGVVVEGGPTRQESAAKALEAAEVAAAVVIHDAARALCPSSLFDECLQALDEHEAACVAVAATETIKLAVDAIIEQTLDRSSLVVAQTPQAFRAEVYRRGHEVARAAGVIATDDCALVERIGVRVRVVQGWPTNIKITSPSDLRRAELILEDA